MNVKPYSGKSITYVWLVITLSYVTNLDIRYVYELVTEARTYVTIRVINSDCINNSRIFVVKTNFLKELI